MFDFSEETRTLTPRGTVLEKGEVVAIGDPIRAVLDNHSRDAVPVIGAHNGAYLIAEEAGYPQMA